MKDNEYMIEIYYFSKGGCDLDADISFINEYFKISSTGSDSVSNFQFNGVDFVEIFERLENQVLQNIRKSDSVHPW